MLENFQRNWHQFSNLLPIKPENSVPNGFYLPVVVAFPNVVNSQAPDESVNLNVAV